MTNTTRAQYTLEYKQEAVRLVRGGQSNCSGGQDARAGRADVAQLGQGLSAKAS